jgi:hypothetical protein
MACPMPLCGLSGATTTTSPILFITLIKVLIPGAVIPSSLVTRISGFFGIFSLFFVYKSKYFVGDYSFLGGLTKNYVQ